MNTLEYWKNQDQQSAMVPDGKYSWEGAEFMRFFQDFLFAQDVIDFGCGFGRLAPYFSKKHYVGLDISAAAIEGARKMNPGYNFVNYVPVQMISSGYTLFAHNVFRYIDDVRMPLVPGHFSQKRVIISEPMGYKFISPTPEGAHLFNREIEAYERALRAVRYRLHRVMIKPAAIIGDDGNPVEITVLEFHRQ